MKSGFGYGTRHGHGYEDLANLKIIGHVHDYIYFISPFSLEFGVENENYLEIWVWVWIWKK